MRVCVERCLCEGHFIIPCTLIHVHDFHLRRILLVKMEEEEEERLRRPPIIQEPEPEEPREQRHRASRVHRGDRREQRGDHRENHSGHQDRPEHRPHGAHSEDEEVEEGEDNYYDEEDNPEVKPCLKPTMRPITAAPSVSSASGNASPDTPGNESPCGIIIPHENSPPNKLPDDENRPKIGLSLKLGECILRHSEIGVEH